MSMVESEKSRIRKRALLTSRGPWQIDADGNIRIGHGNDCKGKGGCCKECGHFVAVMLDNLADAKFIVQAREDVVDVLNALDAAEQSHERIRDLYHAENERLREIIAAMTTAVNACFISRYSNPTKATCSFCYGLGENEASVNHSEVCPVVMLEKAMKDPNLRRLDTLKALP